MQKNRLYFIIALVLLASLAATWMTNRKDASQSDEKALLAFARPLIAGDATYTLKYNATYEAAGDRQALIALGRRLSGNLQLPEGRIDRLQGHLLYETSTSGNNGMNLTLNLVESDKHSAYLVLTLQDSGSGAFTAIKKRQEEIRRQLQGEASDGIWSFSVQGLAAPAFVDPQREIDRLAADGMKAAVVGNYRDSGTVSVTFYSQKLKNHVNSGGKRVNMQMSLHRVTESGKWRLTVGTPLISTEY